MTDQDLVAKKLALIVDPAIVRDVVEKHLGDLLDFVAAVSVRLSAAPA